MYHSNEVSAYAFMPIPTLDFKLAQTELNDRLARTVP